MARWVNYQAETEWCVRFIAEITTKLPNNRKQRVGLNGSSADFSPIESGVPQGSVLGPLLFFSYVNDLEKNIKSNIKFLCSFP